MRHVPFFFALGASALALGIVAACSSSAIPAGIDSNGQPCGATLCGADELCCNVAGGNGACTPYCVRSAACPSVSCQAGCACPAGQICCEEPTGAGDCAEQCVTGSTCPAVACTLPRPDGGQPPGDGGQPNPRTDGDAQQLNPCGDHALSCCTLDPSGCTLSVTPANGGACGPWSCPNGGVPTGDCPPACGPNPVCDQGAVEAGSCVDAGPCGLCPVGDVCCTGGPTLTRPTCFAGVCPVSRREFKTDIAYVDDAERAALAEEALAIRLARYRYKTEPADARRHLGFIIDDQPDPSAAVDADRTHVDLYGYTSALLAAAQEQSKEIRELRARVQELERRAGAR